MKRDALVRVAVNGYGVIGKRVADAVAQQNDTEAQAILDVATDAMPTSSRSRPTAGSLCHSG